MEYIDNKLCIGASEMDGIVASEALQKLIQRGRIERVRRGCYGTPALYSVDSLPYQYKIEVYKRYPDIKAQADAKPFIDTIEPDGAALNYYAEYVITGDRHLPYDKQMEYANNAAIMNAFRSRLELANSQRSRQSKRGVKKADFWKIAAQSLPRLADKYPNGLPQNARRLQDKFNQYLKGGYEVFISGKFLNNNAAKVDDDVKDSVLQTFVSDPRNFDNEFIAKQYNFIAEKMNWHKITAGTVAARAEKYELTCSARRIGGTNFRNTKSMQVKRKRPTTAMLFWTLDGWDAELYYQKTDNGVTTYHNRKTVVVVLDPCINYPVGYAIGDQETPALIASALRNAANHTAELFGSRYRACQVQSDRYAIKKMTPYYEVIADKVTPARAKNSKTKVIEPYFKRFNVKYCQPWQNWSGFGVTSRKESQPNSEWLNTMRHQFPDEEGVVKQLEFAIFSERVRLREKYLELWAATPEERKLPLSDEQYLLTFGSETGYTNVLEGPGLRPRIGGIKHSYDSFNPNFREYSHIKWTVKYDPENLQRVLAVSEDGSLRFMLEEKYVQPMALAERKEGDSDELQRVRVFNKQLEESISGRLAITGKRVDQLFDHNPQLDNSLAKAILVDSRGQHKDRRNQIRLEQPKVVAYTEVPAIPDKASEDETETFNLY